MKKEQKPYEKFLEYGPESLTDSELLAIILRTGTKGKDATALANDILAASPVEKNSLLGLYELTMEDLTSITGIGEVKAVKLLCITELSKRIAMAKAKVKLNFKSPYTVAQYFMEEMRHLETETLFLVCLNTKGQFLSYVPISKGGNKSAPVYPREIFSEAIKQKAANIILLHNHPSGDPSPSKQDEETTSHILKLSKMLEIPLLDHIIIGDNTYFSFLEAEKLQI